MMRALLIGGDSFVGQGLDAELRLRGHVVLPTTRRHSHAIGLGWPLLDLAQPVNDLPDGDVAFVVAAVTKFRGCEGNSESYRVNVDAPIDIARIMAQRGGFCVFVSTDAVEWCGSTAYARQKALAEIGVRLAGGAVVWPGPILPEQRREVCSLLADVGERRLAGVHVWP